MKTFAVGLVALLFAAQGPAKDPKAVELMKLQGKWVRSSLVTSGNENRVEPKFDLLIEGDRMTLVRKSDGGRGSVMKFEIDPTKSPKQIDQIPEEGQGKGRRLPGIFRIDGDRLEICYAVREGKPRPNAFESTQESKEWLITYVRPGR